MLNKKDIHIHLKTWFRKNLGKVPKKNSDLLNSGTLDSFSLMNLVVNCEERFKFRFKETDFQKKEFRTTNGLIKIIFNRLNK